MDAAQLLAVSPPPPVLAWLPAQPPPPSPSSSSSSSSATTYPIRPVQQSEIDDFKSYVSTITLSFTDNSPPVAGRILSNEAEVRSFLESTVNFVVWPIIQAMVPHSATRGYDLVLGSEHHFPVVARTHNAILKVFVHHDVNMSESLLLIEFQACDFLGPHGSSGDGAMDVVSRRRLAKYAVEGNVSTLIVMDNVHAVYVHFQNVRDENAPMEILVAKLAGDAEGEYGRLSVRELVVYAAWKVLGERGLGVRSYRNCGKTPMKYENGMNYSDFGDGPGVVRRTRSDRGKSTRHRFYPHKSAEFKDGAITSHELATIDPSMPPRRPANLFLLAPAKPIYFDADVSPISDNIGFLCSDAAVARTRTTTITPLVLQDLIVKFLAPHACANELAAYHTLKALQGIAIPFCYGLYKSSGSSDHVLLLENVPGAPEPARMLYRDCWATLQRIHTHGIYHGNIQPRNIIVADDGTACAFIGWAKSGYANPGALASDEESLREVFGEEGDVGGLGSEKLP